MKDYSNYHNININEKISHDGLLLLENSLDGFEGYDVLINNSINSRMLIYQKYDADSTIKKIIGKIEDVELGNVLNINGVNWLITTFPEDNKVYRKAEIQLCNSTFPIKSNKTRVLMEDANGNPILDKFGDPVYSYTEGTITQLPCIVESSFVSSDENKQFPLPENQLLITLQYQNADEIQMNKTFTMYNNRYKIRNIDYTKVIYEKGIIVLLVEQVSSEVK